MERGVAVEQGAAVWWEEGAAPLEVVAEAPLEMEGERERMWGAVAVGMVASSSGRGRRFG